MPNDEPGFEEAYRRLEDIVRQLEEGRLSLEESMKLFEEGTRLARFCQKKLDGAELKVSKLIQAAGGEYKLVPFEQAPPPEPGGNE